MSGIHRADGMEIDISEADASTTGENDDADAAMMDQMTEDIARCTSGESAAAVLREKAGATDADSNGKHRRLNSSNSQVHLQSLGVSALCLQGEQ